MPRRIQRSVRSGPKNQVWTSILFSQAALGAGAVVIGDIAAPSDWQVTTTASERATLLRIRGWLSFAPDASAGATGVFMQIVVMDEAAASPNPVASSSYNDFDVLWTGGFNLAISAATPNSGVNLIAIDVKVMRKITNSQDVRLAMRTVGSAGLLSGVVRALVRRGGN